ncbi:MAG: hypothetical protein HKN62_17405 [Phycisphaerales bacterium]|nr:hypothetical protein [Phycisphaerales bacterium]
MRVLHTHRTFERRLHALAAGVLAAATATLVAAAPPTAKSLIAESTKAMGGPAIEKITSYSSTAEMSGPMGAIVSHVSWAKPSHVVVKRVLPQMGEMVQGTDGKIGWTKNPGPAGYSVIREQEMIDNILEQAIHIRLLRLREFVGTELEVENVTERDFDGAPCFGIAFTSKKPGKPESGTMYIDAATKLLRGMELTERGRAATVKLKEWKKIGGVQFFHRMEIADEQMNIVMSFTKIAVNAVDPALVKVPDEVVALAGSQPAKTATMKLEDFSPPVRKMIEDMMEGLPWDDPVALRAARDGMASSAGKVPGEYGTAMKYVIAKIDEKLGG